MGFNFLLFLDPFGRTIPLGVDDGAPRTGLETDTAFLTLVGIDVETNLTLAFDSGFGAFSGAGTASNTVVTDAIGHG